MGILNSDMMNQVAAQTKHMADMEQHIAALAARMADMEQQMEVSGGIYVGAGNTCRRSRMI